MSGTSAFFAAYLFFLSFSSIFAFKTININNNCPISLDIFVDLSSFNGSVAPHDTLSFIVDSDFTGDFYVDVNGGNFAGVFLPFNYYYIVSNPAVFNIGISIKPGDEDPVNGFCGTAFCDRPNCTDSFGPFVSETLNPIPGVPPPAPVHGCDYATIFNITYCPSGTIPNQSGFARSIHPTGDLSKCMDVRGNVRESGTPVQVFDCNNSTAQHWALTRGNTQVVLADTNFCLDAGTNIENGIGMKIWECLPGVPQQAWYYTDDDRIAVANHGQCLTVPTDGLINGTQLQTFQCTDDDVNQFFTS